MKNGLAVMKEAFETKPENVLMGLGIGIQQENYEVGNDFYENLFVTDKIVVKEEKQVVLFYNSLNEKLKKKLEVSSYYDIIDIAYNYYNLFAELQEYKIDLEKVELEKWQEDLFETLKMVDEKVKETCQLKGLILPYMLRNVENISKGLMYMKKIIVMVSLSLSLVACGLVSATGSVVGGTIKAVGSVTGAVIKTTGKIIGSVIGGSDSEVKVKDTKYKFSGVELEIDQYSAVVTGKLSHNGSTKKNLRLSIPCFDKDGNRVGDAIATIDELEKGKKINQSELEYAKAIMRRLHCQVLDVSNKSIEETASLVMQLIDKNRASEGK